MKRYALTTVAVALVLWIVSPTILAIYVIVVTAFVAETIAHRHRPAPYDWPTWVYRARLATLSYLGVHHR